MLDVYLTKTDTRPMDIRRDANGGAVAAAYPEIAFT